MFWVSLVFSPPPMPNEEVNDIILPGRSQAVTQLLPRKEPIHVLSCSFPIFFWRIGVGLQGEFCSRDGWMARQGWVGCGGNAGRGFFQPFLEGSVMGEREGGMGWDQGEGAAQGAPPHCPFHRDSAQGKGDTCVQVVEKKKRVHLDAAFPPPLLPSACGMDFGRSSWEGDNPHPVLPLPCCLGGETEARGDKSLGPPPKYGAEKGRAQGCG